MSRARPRVPAFAKHIATLFALFMIGCSSGSSCSSCGGIEPLPGGFDTTKKIENAGSARLTQSGLSFLQSNIGTLAGNLLGGGTGKLTINIPDSGDMDVGGGLHYELCPAGSTDCSVTVDFNKSAIKLTTGTPHELLVGDQNPASCSNDSQCGVEKCHSGKCTSTLALRVNLPVHLHEVVFGATIASCDLDVAIDQGQVCPANNSPGQVGLNVDISIAADANEAHSRFGYTALQVVSVKVNTDDLSNTLQLCNCGIISDFGNFAESVIIPLLEGTLESTIKNDIDDQLCQKSNPALSPSCPTGTTDVSGTCRYGSDANAACVSTMLGTDGHANLGGLLASLSPGTQGGLDFLFAAGGADKSTMNPQLSWGDLEPINNGGTIGLLGGAEPNPVSKCVKMSELPLPTGIPIPDELFANTVPNWPASVPGPHVGIALSERFSNYGLASAYNSGLLCIGVSTESVALLTSGTISILIPDLKNLALQQESQEIGLVIRPSKPPTLTFGNGTNLTNDPLIRVKLEQASFDFYIFSLDRFVRFMTATYDLDVPVNLTVTDKGLTPVLDKIGVTNGTVTNNTLLSEDPKQIAGALADLISGMVGQAIGGGIAPINLNSALSSFGLALDIPDSVKGKGSPGLRKLTKGTDNYLGIFAAFELASMGTMNDARAHIPIETSAEIVRKDVDPRGLKFGTINDQNVPVVRMRFASPEEDSGHPLEYSYKVDNGFWHPFSDERIVDIADSYFRVQGKHEVSVRGRVVGDAKTIDTTPAVVPVIIDIEPPKVKISNVGDDGTAEITATDVVSDSAHEFVRVRLDGGDWTPWQTADQLRSFQVGKAKDIEVEAKDEEGNVGTAKQALLRGRGAPGAAGCGCEVAIGSSTSNGSLWLLAIALGGVALRLAKKSKKDNGGDDDSTPPPRASNGSSPLPVQSLRSTALRGVTSLALLGVAFSWAGCSCGDSSATATSGGEGCVAPTCQTLEPGLIGEYTSVAVDGKTLWVAGYSDGNWEPPGFAWGDLVVGKWNGKKVVWKSVDGVPDTPPVDGTMFNKSGYRGGQTESGDDVGLWTSIGVTAKGLPAVAYYDRTNRALKFAVNVGGETWDINTVDSKSQSEVGRYPKLIAQNGGWAIVYQSIEPGGEGGAALSRVRMATTSSPKPTASEWTIEDVAVDKESPCRAQFCSGSEVCVASTERCTAPVASCKPSCGTGTACIKASGSAAACVDVFATGKLDSYPDAIGDYIAIAPTADGQIGVVYYDRPGGNLVAASKSSGTWKTSIIDGHATKTDADADAGVGASLAIDASNNWHITYVDGITEALKYVKLGSDLKVIGTPEVIDDGQVLNGVQNADGQHLIGDDSNVFVTDSGEIHVSYADSTSGKLRYAVGVDMAGSHKWTVQVVEQKGFAGLFSHIITLDNQLQIVNWGRSNTSNGPVGDVTVVKP